MSDVEPAPFQPETTDAFDRVQTRRRTHADDARFPWRSVGVVALIVVALAIAWAFLRSGGVAASDNLLVHLIDATATFQPELATTNPEEAGHYIYDELGWAVSPPDLPGLALVGAGLATIGEAPTGSANASPQPVVVPAFRYEGDAGETAYVFVYDYITLDRVRHAFDLPEATYAVLGEPTPVDTRVTDDTYLVTWRVRAMIFTAVTESEPVFERIGQVVSG